VTGAAPFTATGTDRSVSVAVDFAEIQAVMDRAPKIVHFWVRGFLELSFIRHRLEWLRRKGTRFGRRSDSSTGNAVRVYPVNAGPAAPKPSDVIYRVDPKEQRAPSVQAAIAGLKTMRAEAFAGSLVLRVHEFGEDVRAGKRRRFLAVPIKTRPGSPAEWVKKNPGKKLELRPSKKFPGEGALYEITKVRGRGRPRKGQTLPVLKEKLRLRFVLKRIVDMKPTLHFYDTWGQMKEQRDQLWRGAADKMAAQLQKGDPRDF
jgi:hypothetical protein